MVLNLMKKQQVVTMRGCNRSDCRKEFFQKPDDWLLAGEVVVERHYTLPIVIN